MRILGMAFVALVLFYVWVIYTTAKSKTSKIIIGIGGIACIICVVYLLLSGSGGGGGRDMGRCWICGKKGSFQMDGSYYCFEHYNQRMFGKIG